jgi:histidinol-phosphate phosphatase family protein
MTTDQFRLGQGASVFNPATLPGRRLLTQTQPTIFVDRDGVINQNRPDHVLSWTDFQFIDDSIKALALLNQAGYQVIVVTNQAAISRGLFSVQELDYIHYRMTEAIEAGGGKVKSILYCTHLPNAG